MPASDRRPRVLLFGRLEVWASQGQAVAFTTARSKHLLALLVIENGALRARDRLVDELWSEGDREQLRKSLNTEVWRLRRALRMAGEEPDEWLRAGADGIRFCDDCRAWVDVHEFDRLLLESDATPDILEPLLAAERLYRGDLVEDVYDDWCVLARESYRARLHEALERLLAHVTRAGDWDSALRVARRIAKLDPFLEHIHRVIMRCLRRLGERAAALRHFQALERDLRRELGVAPAAETVALYEALKDDRAAEPAGAAAPPAHMLARLAGVRRTLSALIDDVDDMIAGAPPLEL